MCAFVLAIMAINLEKEFKAIEICPNVSKCMQIEMKWLYIIQFAMKLFEAP